MSRRLIALLTGLGAIAGAYVGVGFLDDGGSCAGSQGIQCHLNQVYLPFFNAVVIGMVAALVVGMIAKHVARHGFRSAPERQQTTRAAVEIDDPFLRLATWGIAPRQDPGSSATKERKPAFEAVNDSLESLEEASWGVIPREDPIAAKARRARVKPKPGTRGRPVPRPRQVA